MEIVELFEKPSFEADMTLTTILIRDDYSDLCFEGEVPGYGHV